MWPQFVRRLWTSPRDQYMSSAWLQKCRSPKYQPPIARAKGQLRSAWQALRATLGGLRTERG